MNLAARGIVIVTVEDDLHALVVQEHLQRLSSRLCYVVESDRLSGRSGLSWTPSSRTATLPTRTGEHVRVDAIDVVWWRRVNQPPKIDAELEDIARDIVANDCRSALEGVLLSAFRGQWVNSPDATRLAENKLVQLGHARDGGFRIPRTLVSQDPTEIRAFCASCDRAIVKSVKGTNQAGLLTLEAHERLLASDDMLSLAPAMYQEWIPGSRHLRVNCFGDRVYATQIETAALDWRPDLTVPIINVDVADDLANRLRGVLGGLGLRMGIVDLKLTPEGEPVWLEVNPQGQFLFLQGITGRDLITPFAEFLLAEADLGAERIAMV